MDVSDPVKATSLKLDSRRRFVNQPVAGGRHSRLCGFMWRPLVVNDTRNKTSRPTLDKTSAGPHHCEFISCAAIQAVRLNDVRGCRYRCPKICSRSTCTGGGGLTYPGGDLVSVDENKALVRFLIEEGLNKGNLSVADEHFTADYMVHIPGRSDLPRGPQSFKQVIGMWRAAFPDFHMTIEDLVAEGNMVANRFTTHGTHRRSLDGQPAHGKADGGARAGASPVCQRQGGRDMGLRRRPFDHDTVGYSAAGSGSARPVIRPVWRGPTTRHSET